jgi:branched-chain amino acid transport system permease protein
MYQFGEILISGLSNGAVYAVMAIGMALVYGVTRVFNFAYGSFYTLGGYFAWSLLAAGVSYWFAVILVVPMLLLAGALTERLVIRPLRKRPDWEVMAMMATLGLALMVDNTYQGIFGSSAKSLPAFASGTVDLFGVVVDVYDIAVFGCSIGIVVAVMLFLDRTRHGMAMEAVAQDMTGAEIVGIPKDRMFTLVFAISAVLVGMSAILLAPKFYFSPFGGWEVLVKAWVITALGGMGSIRGAIIAAFLLGLLEAFVGFQFGYMYILIAWVVVLLLVLTVRPQGLLGTWG